MLQGQHPSAPDPARSPWAFIILTIIIFAGLWLVGYAQAIPFVIPFYLISGMQLMNLLGNDIPRAIDANQTKPQDNPPHPAPHPTR